ncbi:MAG: ABC transporter ATP-binding protein, partial [Pseudomonadota bacterium]
MWTRPANESVARYLGYRNVFKGTAAPHADGTSIDLGHFSVVLGGKIPAGKETSLCIRQQDIRIIREGKPVKDSLSRNVFPGEIVDLFTTSDSCSIWFRIDGSPHHHDLEAKFPLNIRGRYDLFKGKNIRMAFVE